MIDDVADDLDLVFKALADPTRRQLLDRLHERNGQTLGELCGSLSMARQSASQHLGVLEAANLISTTWRGREKLHYLNPVPLHDMQERWIDKFERPRLRALSAIRHSAEEQAMTAQPTLRLRHLHQGEPRSRSGTRSPTPTSPPATGATATSPTGSRARPGSTSAPTARASPTSPARSSRRVPPERLVLTFPGSEEQREDPSQVTFTIEPHQDIVRLTVRHEGLPTAERLRGHLRAAGRPSWPTSSRCWRPARCCPRRRGRCTPSSRRADGAERPCLRALSGG